MRPFGSIALVLALAAPAQAQLPDLTYNAFSASFTSTDLDHATDDADSFTVGASYEISDTLHLWGRVDRTALDEAIEIPFLAPGVSGVPRIETKVRSLGLAAGAGVHRDLTDSLSGYARLGIAYADSDARVSASGVTFDGTAAIFESDSFGASDSSTDLVGLAGLRYKAAERVELFGGLSQVGGDSTGGHAGVEFRLENGWGVQLAGVVGEDSQGLLLGVVRRF